MDHGLWIVDGSPRENEWKNEDRNGDCCFGNREDVNDDDSMTGMCVWSIDCL